MIAWAEQAPSEFDTTESRVNIKNIDIGGANNFHYQLGTLVGGTGLSLTKLSDDNIMIAYADQTGNPRVLYGAIINPTGSVTTGPVTINGDVVDTEIAAVGFASGGGAAVLYTDGSSGTGSQEFIKLSILNSFMSVTNTIDVYEDYEVKVPQGALLSNGNVAFIFQREGSIDAIVFCIYTPTGTEVTKTVLSTNLPFSSSALTSIVACDDGGIVTSWGEVNGNDDEVLTIRKHNADGSTVSTVTVNDPPASDPGDGGPYDTWRASSLFKLDDGKIGLAGWSSGSRSLYAWVYDQDLNTVQSMTLMTTDTQPIGRNDRCSIAAFGNGYYGFVSQRNGSDGTRVYVDVMKDNQ